MKHIHRRMGFWFFLPFTALQGLWLKQTATRLPEASGDRSGICGQGRKVHLLAMGDSIIAGVGTGNIERSLPVQFAQSLAEGDGISVHWHVEGKNGADISDLRQGIKQLTAGQKADVVLISIGVNDVTGLSTTRKWRTQMVSLVEELKRKWPQARILFVGLPPMGKFPLPPQPLRFMLGQRAATMDAIAAEVISKQDNMLHIPTDIDPVEQEFCEDGFHPSAESCAHWARELAQRFEADNLVP